MSHKVSLDQVKDEEHTYSSHLGYDNVWCGRLVSTCHNVCSAIALLYLEAHVLLKHWYPCTRMCVAVMQKTME